MRRRRERRLALGLALGAALLLGVFLPGAEGAGPKKGAASLRQQQTGLAARSRTALLTLYALDSRLARARSELAGLRNRAQGLKLERERVRQEIDIVAGNLRASQRLLGERLRALYEEGEPDAIAVLLGAASLDEAVTRLDELERGARQGAQAARDAQDGRTKLQGLAIELAARIREVQALEARAARTATVLQSARAHRPHTVPVQQPATRHPKRPIAIMTVAATASAYKNARWRPVGPLKVVDTDSHFGTR